MDIRREALGEAITVPGLVTPATADSLLPLIPLCEMRGPKAVATGYRKAEPQISREAKQALGIRSNGFMSVAARAELTTAREKAPLEAHYLTLLRAEFTIFRANRIAEAAKINDAELRYEGAVVRPCAACDRHEGHIVENPFPPPGCEVPWCPAGVRLKIDFIGQIENVGAERTSPGKSIWRRMVDLVARR